MKLSKREKKRLREFKRMRQNKRSVRAGEYGIGKTKDRDREKNQQREEECLYQY